MNLPQVSLDPAVFSRHLYLRSASRSLCETKIKNTRLISKLFVGQKCNDMQSRRNLVFKVF